MTKDLKVAAIFAIAGPVAIGGYFASDLFDSGITSNPHFTRAYFATIGLSLVAGMIRYWFERQERGRNDAQEGRSREAIP